MSTTSDAHEHPELPGPLSSLEIRDPRATALNETTDETSTRRPLALRALRPSPTRQLPPHHYDPRLQIAVDSANRPLAPSMDKDWTTIEGTHTDGDGGDNELWDWEEIK